MKNNFYTATFTLVLVSYGINNALANSDPGLKPFSSECKSTEQVGFHREKGQWKPTLFTLETYTVKKFSEKELIDLDHYCLNKINKKNATPVGMFGNKLTYGCYDINNLNATFSHPTPSDCMEKYDTSGKLEGIYCDNMIFHPNGEFVKKPNIAMGTIGNSEKYKRPMIIAVGKCNKQ